jgi:hypothetical protein
MLIFLRLNAEAGWNFYEQFTIGAHLCRGRNKATAIAAILIFFIASGANRSLRGQRGITFNTNQLVRSSLNRLATLGAKLCLG